MNPVVVLRRLTVTVGGYKSNCFLARRKHLDRLAQALFSLWASRMTVSLLMALHSDLGQNQADGTQEVIILQQRLLGK